MDSVYNLDTFSSSGRNSSGEGESATGSGPSWYWNWQGNQSARNATLLSSGFLTDIVILVGPSHTPFRAHRLFLQIGSPVFNRVLGQNPKLDKLEIPSVDTLTFQKVLNYLYTGEKKVSIEEALPVVNIALKLELTDLVTSCVDALKAKLTQTNVLKLFQQAMNFANKKFIQKCLLYISKNARKLLVSQDFLNLTLDCVYEIVERDDLRPLSELQLFEAVLRWGHAECDRKGSDPFGLTPRGDTNLKDEVKKLIPHIRFAQMTKKEFVGKVLTEQILAEREERALLTILDFPNEERLSLHKIRGANEFNGKPRDYFDPPERVASRFKNTAMNRRCYVDFIPTNKAKHEELTYANIKLKYGLDGLVRLG